MSNNIDNGIKKIENWIYENGFVLLNGKSDHICLDEKYIKINFNKKKEYVLYSLLHEAGHLKLYKKGDYKREFHRLAVEEHKKRKTKYYFYTLLKEELYAWETGLKIAKKLKINLNEKEYRKYSAESFLKYVKYTYDYINYY